MAPPETIAGRYRVLRELGRGGMGVVYLVEHQGTGDQLALKLLLDHAGASAEMVERFKREARAPARIKSENVVRVTDTDVAPELGNAPFMVMELLNGRDLEKTLGERHQLPPTQVVELLQQAASALDKAHALGITHRDLKPENLFLHRRESGEEVLKILDFGISKMGGDANDISHAGLTKTGAMMGTPLYMSPEQARGRNEQVGPSTDIWAIGLIAHRLLTGTIYWTATTIGELMVQVIYEPMPPPSTLYPGLPPAFDAWFARSTDREPARRFSSVREQIDALALALGVSPLTASRIERASLATSFVATATPAPLVGMGATEANLASSQLRLTQSGTGRSRGALVVAAALVVLVGVAGGIAGLRSHGSATEASPTTDLAPIRKTEPRPIETSNPEPAPPPIPAPAAPTSKSKPVSSASAKPSAQPAVTMAAPSVAAPSVAPAPPKPTVVEPSGPPKPPKYDPTAP